MKQFIVAFLSPYSALSLTLLLASTLAVAPVHAVVPVQGGPGGPPSEPPGQPEVVVEMLEGSPAREHLRRIAERHPERFEQFGEELRNHGYDPTDSVTILRTRKIGLSDFEYEKSLDLPWKRVSSSVSSSQGEVVLHSWDDGYDGTWEGLIYTERYSDGAWSTHQGQINIETASYYSVWSQRTGGGAGGGGNPWEVDVPESAVSLPAFTEVSAIGGLDYYLVGPGPFSPFVACLISGSIGCSGACFFSGPMWAPCMAGCLGVVVLYCSLSNLIY